MVYANPALSSFEIPENSADDLAFVSYKDGKRVSAFSNGELAQHAQRLWSEHFSASASPNPVFFSVNIETPLALTAFIANNANLQKVYVPSSFNVNKIIESIKVQQSTTLVCDADLYTLQPPKERALEFEGHTSTISKTVIASDNGKHPGKSALYKGDSVVVDPYRL